MSIFATRTPAQTETMISDIYGSISRRIEVNSIGMCPVDLAKNILDICHSQSCGKCTPCRIGLGQLSELMRQVLDGEATLKTLETIRKTAEIIADSADCAIGYDSARLVITGLKAFMDDFESHVLSGICLASHNSPIPCMAHCPAGVDVPGYISLIADNRPADAVKLIRKDNPFPAACAYICEHPCEEHCRRSMMDDPINIRGLKKYAVTESLDVEQPLAGPSTGKKVAVIGGGPSGLSCAYYLALMGHRVSLYERQRQLGGMLRYGIPSYRFPREALDKEIESILSVGIDARTEINIGTDITMDEIKKENDAVYIAIGAQLEKDAGLRGGNAEGVISAVELLRNIGDDIVPDFRGKNIVVIGGGNVAMDATRSAIRFGAQKVSCVYRRRKEDMAAQLDEVEGALAEGAEILCLQAPVRVETDEDGKALALVTQPQIIGEIGSDGRPRINKAELMEQRIPADIVIIAIGQAIERDIISDLANGVFIGGDCKSGPATAVKAIAAGKEAAFEIDEYLGFDHDIDVDVSLPPIRIENKPSHARINLMEREACERKYDFDAMENSMSCQEAGVESSRCLHCDYFGYGSFRGGRKEL